MQKARLRAGKSYICKLSFYCGISMYVVCSFVGTCTFRTILWLSWPVVFQYYTSKLSSRSNYRKCISVTLCLHSGFLVSSFRNERKHLVDDPAVILRKKSKGSAAVKGTFVSAKLRHGVLNWEPSYPEGEDEASIKKHTGSWNGMA